MTTQSFAEFDQPFDVVIAGAGLAGSSLAIRLARKGVRVALLDYVAFPRDKLCGEYLSPECWDALERLGLAGPIAAAGPRRIRRVRLSTPRGRVLDVECVDRDGRPGMGLSRGVLDQLMIQQARLEGAHVFEKERAGSPILEDGRVAGLVVRHTDGEYRNLRATVSIAADGRHSGLVRRTGRTWTRSRFRTAYFGMKRHLKVADTEANPPDTVGLHLFPGGYGGTCRIESPFTNFCALLPESTVRHHRGQLDEVARGEFLQNPMLAQLQAHSEPAGDWKAIAGVRVEWSRPRVPGILYAGDCQGTIDPLGGQGMTMALLGAELLTPFVTAAIQSGSVSSELQRTYASAWHRRFDKRIRLCRIFHHVLVNPGLVDVASAFKTLAPRLLAAGFELTRDNRPAAAEPLT